MQESFFGIQKAITDYVPGKKHWCATLIHTGTTAEELENRRMIGLAQIKASCGIIQVIDLKPITWVHQGEACHDTVGNLLM